MLDEVRPGILLIGMSIKLEYYTSEPGDRILVQPTVFYIGTYSGY